MTPKLVRFTQYVDYCSNLAGSALNNYEKQVRNFEKLSRYTKEKSITP